MLGNIWNKAFWASTAERAVKTFAQSTLALFLGNTALNVLNANWGDVFAVSGTAAFLSLLMSIGSAGVGPDGSPSLVGEPPVVNDAGV